MKFVSLFFVLFLSHFLSAQDCQFYYLGIPKSGNHYLWKVLQILNDGKPVEGNYPHPDNYQREIANFQKHGNKTFIFLIRDPRDVLLSAYEYIKNGPINHDKEPNKFNYWHLPLRRNPRYLYMTDQERMLEMIRMSKDNLLICSERIYTGYKIAMNASTYCQNVKIFRFEDLIGPKGGGSVEAQRKALTRLAELTGLPLENVDLAIEEGWGEKNLTEDKTFRHGVIGRWKEAFDKIMIDEFKKMHNWNTYLLFFGYETQFNWHKT